MKIKLYILEKVKKKKIEINGEEFEMIEPLSDEFDMEINIFESKEGGWNTYLFKRS